MKNLPDKINELQCENNALLLKIKLLEEELDKINPVNDKSLRKRTTKSLKIRQTRYTAGGTDLLLNPAVQLKKKQGLENYTDEHINKLKICKKITELSPFAIAVYDAGGVCMLCNDSLAKILGLTKDEILQQNLRDIKLFDYSGIYKIADDVLVNGGVRYKEIYITRSGNKSVWVDAYFSAFTADNESYLFIMLYEITGRKENEEKTRHYADTLYEINETRNKFFSIISHDLKSPFLGLMGVSKLLHEEYDTLTDEDIKCYNELQYAAIKNLYNLIENLLQWSGLQLGHTNFHPVRMNLKGQISSLIDLLKINALDKDIIITNSVAEDIHIKADKNMFSSIMQNLLSNAIKFTGENGKVNIAGTLAEEFVRISIDDSGIGIKQENLQKLFSIDSHYTTPGTRNEKGTGFGLILTKELVEKHGGKIWVESKPNKGTRFIFSIPLSR